jgi:excisionase family DNA binding protein
MSKQQAADLAVSLSAAMTIDQFCRAYSVGKTKAYSEIRAGKLKIRKLGSKTLVARADADAWLNSLPAVSTS